MVYEIVDELESVTDYLQKIVGRIEMVENSSDTMDPRTKDNMLELYNYVQEYFSFVCEVMDGEKRAEPDSIRVRINEYNDKAEQTKETYLKRVSEEKVSAMLSLTVGDLVNDMGRIFSHSRRVVQYVAEKK